VSTKSYSLQPVLFDCEECAINSAGGQRAAGTYTRNSLRPVSLRDARGLAALLLSVPLLSTALSAETWSRDPPRAAMDAYVKTRVKVNDFSVAVLVARRGKILLSRGYGRGEPGMESTDQSNHVI
jgi:hypothetical protein